MYRRDIIDIVVDDLISKAMAYNETLHADHSLVQFDFAANQLCKGRMRVIRFLRSL